MLVQTAHISLFIQFITGLIDVYGLTFEVKEEFQKFKDLLKIELSVQAIEFIFYLWMVINILSVENITKYRYFDWFITTPVMLTTLMMYYDTETKSVNEFLNTRRKEIGIVFILNFLMLLFGLLGELNSINYNLGGLIGFLPFIFMFIFIYRKYVYDKEDKRIFYYFLLFWSLYGVAYFFNYELKNSMYNILDLFAKNGFGLILVYILYQNKIIKST